MPYTQWHNTCFCTQTLTVSLISLLSWNAAILYLFKRNSTQMTSFVHLQKDSQFFKLTWEKQNRQVFFSWSSKWLISTLLSNPRSLRWMMTELLVMDLEIIVWCIRQMWMILRLRMLLRLIQFLRWFTLWILCLLFKIINLTRLRQKRFQIVANYQVLSTINL